MELSRRFWSNPAAGTGNSVAQPEGMRVKTLLAAAMVVISSTAFVGSTEGAQRQRRPGGEARSGSGGENQGSNGGGGGAAQRQDGGSTGERSAAPRNGNGNGNGNRGARRESGGDQANSRPQGVRAPAERLQPATSEQPDSR